VRQKDTSAEAALRRVLFARGLRYRLQVRVLSKPRRVADLAFIGARVAVFVDGCFWHGCPVHATWPKNNAEFWRAKILANQQRDLDTNTRLRAEGWEVVRVWAHEEPDLAAARIEEIVRSRRPAKESA
jgi:DNA mismatch endonuclease (patch repair protein)